MVAWLIPDDWQPPSLRHHLLSISRVGKFWHIWQNWLIQPLRLRNNSSTACRLSRCCLWWFLPTFSSPIQRRNRLYLYIHLPSTFTISSNPHSNSLKLVGQIQSSTEETKALGSLCDLSEGTACEGGTTPSSWVFRLLILLFPLVSSSGLFSRANSCMYKPPILVKHWVRVTLSPQPYSPFDSCLALRERCSPGDKCRCSGGPPWTRLRETGPTLPSFQGPVNNTSLGSH